MARFKELAVRFVVWFIELPWHYLIAFASVLLIVDSVNRLGAFNDDNVARTMMLFGVWGMACIWINIGLAGVNLSLTLELPRPKHRAEDAEA